MSVFSEKFSPNELKDKEFIDFALHMMAGYCIDISQPWGWNNICVSDGRPASQVIIGRKVAVKLGELGGLLTPALLKRILTTFKIHGPAIPDELAWINQPKPDEAAA